MPQIIIADTLVQTVDTLARAASSVGELATKVVDDIAHSSHALPPLITDLALILVVAAAVTLLFRQLKQPLVLGYIIAGFLVGPHFGFFPSVLDDHNIETLAKIGVIFLLFSLGLEFSFKKLMRVGGSATITAGVEIAFITITGYLVGKVLGWSTMDCLFLGGMLASSSTTIILKAFDDLGVKSKNYAKIVFGVLVVEDIVVILLMVLLSTIAVTQHIEGIEMAITVGKLGFFLILWFLMGIFLVPTILKKLKKILNEETLLILSIGLCLGMVVLATQVGFSAELGAFIMGSIFAETTSAEKVEHLIKPVKDLFGAVFFVSIGMMVDPEMIVKYGFDVLIVTLLVIFGKFISTAAGAILSGQNLKQSVQVGMSMAQIGEFAFIVATIGLTAGVISESLFPIAVAVSAITTFTTPYMIKYSENFYNLIVRILPSKVILAIDSYSVSTQTIKAESDWRKMVKGFISTITTNSIIVLAIMIGGVQLLLPLLRDIIPNFLVAGLIFFVVILLVSSPFLWGLMMKRHNNMKTSELWQNKNYNNGPLLIMELVRITIGFILIGYLADRAFSTLVSAIIVIPVIVFVLFFFSKNIQKYYSRIEDRFMSNFNSREIEGKKDNKEASIEKMKEKFNVADEYLSTWDIHLIDLEVSQDGEYIGKMLRELDWRETYGITVVYIKRGDKLYYAPVSTMKILPFDHIGVIASEEQMYVFKPVFDRKDTSGATDSNVDDIVLEKFVVDEDDAFNGKSIKDSGIKEKTNSLIVGIERENERIVNPDADFKLKENDIVWVVGEKKQLKKIKS